MISKPSWVGLDPYDDTATVLGPRRWPVADLLTPELLAAYREVVAASDADAKLTLRKREHVTGPALAAVFALGPKAYGIEGMARVIVAQADEVARLTRERDEARAQGAAEERAAVVAWLLADGEFGSAAAIERGEHLPKRTRPTEPPVVVVRREVADE